MRRSITYTVTIKQLVDDKMTARERLAQAPQELLRLVAKEVVEEYIRATRLKEMESEREAAKYVAPAAGFLRLPEVLALIPVGKTTWWHGVRSGRFPKPVKLSPRCTAWKAEDIQKLAREFSGQARNARIPAPVQ